MNLKFDIKSLLKRKAAESPDGVDGSPAEGSQVARKVAVWIKANALVVVLGVVSISAAVGAVIFSGDIQVENEEAAAAIGAKFEEMARLERTPVSILIPGNEVVTGNVAVNRKLVELVKDRMADGVPVGNGVSASALTHNRGVHAPIMSLRLAASDSKFKQVHLDMYDKLKESYAALVKECRGVLPPSEEDVMIELQRSKLRFIEAELNQTIDVKLTTEQQTKLVADLSARRLKAYKSVADDQGIYVDEAVLGAPSAALDKPNLSKLWDLQWKFWIAEDIVRACVALNNGASISVGPVKRIAALRPLGRLAAGTTTAEGGEGEVASDASAGDGSALGSALGSGARPIDPNAMVSMADYQLSTRGWASNQLYDVYRTRVTLIVETAKIPAVVNALAKQNFIAITDAKIARVDLFEAIRDGYYYGENPVSKVTLTLESVWLRQWTGPLMPDEVRATFGTTGQVQSALAPTEDPSQVQGTGTQEQ